MSVKRRFGAAAIPFALWSLVSAFAGCGRGAPGGTQNPPPAPSTITSVSVSPASISVQPGASQAFQVKVTGTGSFSSAVTWSVNGTAGGSSTVGLINSAGIYTAPATPPNPNTVTVSATSTQDTSKSGSVSALVGNAPFDITSISFSPLTATVNTGWTEPFTGYLLGTGPFNPALVWAVNNIRGGSPAVGTIDNNGLYAAPATVPPGGIVTVSAASQAYPSITASAQVTIVPDPTVPPVLSQLLPATADAGQLIQISGTGFFSGASGAKSISVYFTGVNGIKIPAPFPAVGGTASDTIWTVIVPLGATDGSVSLSTQPQNGPLVPAVNTLQFTRAPRIRIRAPLHDLSSGETESFRVKQIAGSTPVTLAWTATAGSVTSDGVYTAPSNVTADTYVTITACAQGTSYCDQEMLGVHPFRIAPLAPSTAPGQSLQLQAIQGNSILSPTWTLGGPGALGNSGLFTASTDFTGGGGVPFLAAANGASVKGLAEVSGQFPGLVNRIADYIDASKMADQINYPYGFTTVYSIAIVNNRLYAESNYYNSRSTAPNSPIFVLDTLEDVDVYDITDPVHPVWVDAFEPPVLGELNKCGNALYVTSAATSLDNLNYPGGMIASYNLSGPSAVLNQAAQLPATNFALFEHPGCTFAAFSSTSQTTIAPGSTTAIRIYQLQDGNIATADYTVPIPASPDNQAWTVQDVGSDGKRLYMDLTGPLVQGQIATYDLTAATPTLLSLLPPTGAYSTLQLMPIGNLLLGSNLSQTFVYDVSGNTPVLESTLNDGYWGGGNGSTVVMLPGGAGMHLVDLSNPQSPVIGSTLYDYSGLRWPAIFSGNYLYDSFSGAGIEVWDISKKGGPIPTELSNTRGLFSWESFAGDGSTGFMLGSNGEQGALSRYDLTRDPPQLIATTTQQGADPITLALSGATLYEGTTTELQVLDTSGSGAPTSVASIPNPVASMAITGSSLLVGTGDNRLVVYDISQPKSPVHQASVGLPSLPFQIAASGNLALVADGSGGLLIYSVAAPSNPTLLSKVTGFPYVYGAAIDGTVALLAAREYGLVVVDLSNPALPKVLGHADVGDDDAYGGFMFNKAYTVTFLNKVAYVGVFNMDPYPMFPDNGSAEIYGFDYSNPSQPRLVSLSGDGVEGDFTLGLWASSNTLICACANEAFSFDLTQPRNVIGMFPFPAPLRPVQDPGSISPALRAGIGASRFPSVPKPLSPRVRPPSGPLKYVRPVS